MAKKNIQNIPQGVKASLALFIASLITKGIAYITTPLFTRLLTPDEYGQVSLFLTWMQVMGIIAMFCLSYGVFNNGMIDYQNDRDTYSFSMLVLSNIITIIFAILVLFLYPFLKNIINIKLSFILLMCIIFLFQPAYNFWSARQRYELKYKKTVIWSIISAVISPLIALLFVISTGEKKMDARIYGAEIPLIIIYIMFYITIAVKSRCKINITYWKTALLFNMPLIPHYLSAYLLSSSDRIMISNLIGDAATAYYSVAYSVAAIALIIWSAINSSLIPFTYENCKKNNYKAISAVTMPILTAFAIICTIIIMLAPEVVSMMASNKYLEAIYVIPPITGGVFFQVQYYIYANIVYYHKKPIYVMYASVSAMVLNIVLNYIFISRYGYIAAGYTTIFCYIIQAIFDYIAMRKVVREKVYNMKYIFTLSIIVIVVALLSNTIYNMYMVRYTIIGLILILCIIYKKKIINTYNNIRNMPD